MIRKLGSVEDFEYQYGTVFSASDFSLASRECLTRLHNREVRRNRAPIAAGTRNGDQGLAGLHVVAIGNGVISSLDQRGLTQHYLRRRRQRKARIELLRRQGDTRA